MTVPENHSSSLDSEGYFAVIPEWILDAPISAQSVRLYAVIRRYADSENKAWPSRTTLATRMRTSVKTIDRSLRELQELGALTVINRKNEAGDKMTNLYKLRIFPGGVGTPVSLGRDTGVARGRDTGVSRVGTPVSHRTRANEPEPIETEKESLQSPSALLSPTDAIRLSDSQRLAEHLADRIADNGSRRPAVTKSWVDAIEKMIRIDGREASQIERAIDWAQNDEFWSTNILSPQALRRQYDRLRLQAQRSGKASRPKGISAVAEYLEMVEG